MTRHISYAVIRSHNLVLFASRVCIPNSAWAILSQEGCHPPQGWDRWKWLGRKGPAQALPMKCNFNAKREISGGKPWSCRYHRSSQGLLVSLFGAPPEQTLRKDLGESLPFAKWRQESQVGSGEARQSRETSKWRVHYRGPSGTLRETVENVPQNCPH